jgi:amino acid transporter
MTLVFYILTAVGFTIFGSVSTQSSIANNLGVDLPWWLYALPQVAVVGFCGYRGIEFSTRILGLVVAVELVLIMVFNVVTLISGGPSGLSARPFTWESLTSGSITAAVLFVIAFFVGFESTAIFREEARSPQRTIPRATLIVTAAIAIFYFLTTYCFIIGLGPGNAVNAASTDPAGSFVTAVTGALGNSYAQVVSVMVVTSSVAAQLAMVTVTTRYIYSFSVDGVVAKKLSVIHKRHNAPSRAALATIILTASGVAAVAISSIDATRAYGTFSGVLEFGFEVLVLLVSAAVVVFFLRNRHTGESAWSTLIAPVLSIVIWGWLLFASLANAELLLGTPTPLTTVIIGLLAAAFVGGLVFASWAAVRKPDVYARIGRDAA